MASCLSSGKKAKRESTMGPNWLELPKELTTNILQRLGVAEIVTSASQVCSLWWNICKDPLMWRTIDMSEDSNHPNYKFEMICRNAIDRSCGHLEDISIGRFATNDLLKYIADRTNRLRCFQLQKCMAISDKGLIEVAKKLSQLEEFDISYTNLTKDSLKAIGRCCPNLKALKFKPYGVLYDADADADAFAIAETMPKLRHLQFVQNRFSNEGLDAILDGCPLLEYLDLGFCHNKTYLTSKKIISMRPGFHFTSRIMITDGCMIIGFTEVNEENISQFIDV
ncbi:putative F-box/LRR-repeat protein 23 [Lotus japonicus]|uniref:putative F-box/LRR-repeat protein 23 n=1 Tax=Lotus japonicus TaxID=34305 RepID=UPI00258C95A0|nr:putative F-box/LRR-repeat protein 23 [Lotus japonicus]